MRILLARLRANRYNETIMKRRMAKSLGVVLCALAVASAGGAEEKAPEGDLLDGIKTEMVAALQENTRLAEENETLRAQLIGLQLEVEQRAQDVGERSPAKQSLPEGARELGDDRRGGWDDPDQDALIQEAQNIYLSGQMLETSETQRLRELQLYDLQYEKQELQLDLKSAEYLNEKLKKEQGPEIDSLQQDIKINRAKIDEISVRVAEQEKAALAYPQKIELLKMENAALKKKIGQLRRYLR
jgi:hypothetical protein